MNPNIFREYDIRGIADEDLTDEVVVILGRTLGTYMSSRECRRIVVGRDCRLSSSRLRDRLAEGLLSTGLDVIDIGVCPTPLLYFGLYRLNVDGGVMITGSHNPPEYNGLKISLGQATIYGRQIQELRDLAGTGDFVQGAGQLEKQDLATQYLEYLQEAFGRLENPPRVVVDCGNGTASDLAPQIYRELGCDVTELFCRMDGRFPNHHPDPTIPENLQDLIRALKESKADLGIAFDGDADRIGAIDDKGHIIWGDQLLIVYSRDVLRDHPGATIIGDVKSSKVLYDDIERQGGRAIMWKAGHSLIKAKMKEEKAALAGEMSGHVFFADRFPGYDDALYAGARLLEILSKTGRKLSEMLSDLPEMYSTPELRVDSPEEYKFEVVKQAQEYFGRHYETNTVDGVRIRFEDGWGLIRASNTQPALVLRFEAESPRRLEEIRNLVEGKLNELRAKTEQEYSRRQVSQLRK
ncbi:MAG: phosphomannomutase/phosphoglucomutase [Acidobacteriota bacterium]